MFHNIFSKIIRKKSKEKIKPKIIADIHEKNSLILAELIEKEKNKEIEVIIHALKIGDYLIGNTIIERKTIPDLISSMINKRLAEQLNQMKIYDKQLLIIEGNSEDFDDFNNPDAIKGFILSIINNYQTPIIFTRNAKDTANYLIILSKQQLKSKKEISLHSRIPKTLKEQKRYILEAFPGIGPITAKKLIKNFNNLNEIFNASEEKLEKILKKRARNFKKVLEN